MFHQTKTVCLLIVLKILGAINKLHIIISNVILILGPLCNKKQAEPPFFK